MSSSETDTLELFSVDRHPDGPGIDILDFKTSGGVISGRYHYTEGASVKKKAAVIWVGGAGGGLTGPAGGLYTRLAVQLVLNGTDSLRLDYRHPNHLNACVLDSLVGAAYMQKLDYRRLILVGHSFGGAVVITAGAQSSAVIGVLTLASQNAGTSLATDLSPRALFLLHGEADAVLDDYCSRDIYIRAGQPKQLILYPGCGHNFDECRDQVDRDVYRWISELVQLTNPA